MRKLQKSASCVKDGYRQLELDKCFLTSVKKIKSIDTKKMELNASKIRKRLFKEEIIEIDDDEDSAVIKKEQAVLEESASCSLQVEVTAQSSSRKENNLASPGCGNNRTKKLSLKKSIRETATQYQVDTFENSVSQIVSLNKPVKEVRSPVKVKPRVLQSFSSNQSNSSVSSELVPSGLNSPTKLQSLSQCSVNSDDTIIYDPSPTDTDILHLTPPSRLILKVNENVQATRFSSVAYKKVELVPLNSSQSPKKKKPGSPLKSGENELSNPRAVNFVTKIVKYVFSQPHLKYLFSEEEIATFDRFFSLPLPEYNYFCYKLFTRQPRWYNIFKLCEIMHLHMDTGQILKMHECLGSTGFVFTDYSSEPVEQLLNILQVKEVREICDSFKLKTKTGKKLQLIEYLIQNCSKQTTLTSSKNSNQILRERISEKLGRCVKLSDTLYDLLHRVHLLYSLGSSEFSKPHDLYLFIDKIENSDVSLPEYTVNTNPLFTSREDFLAFAKACEYKNEFLNAFDSKNRDTMVEISRVVFKILQGLLNERDEVRSKPSYLLRFTAGAKYASTLSIASKHLAATCPHEVKEWLTLLLSQKFYCRNKRGFWYDQLAMIETKYVKNYEQGAKIIIEALEDDAISQVALHDLSIRGTAMKNSKKYRLEETYVQKISGLITHPPDYVPFPSIVIDAKAIEGNESGRKRTYVESENGTDTYLINVEQIALNHYKRNGFLKGVHCEGALLLTLFSVLFWDIIYDSKVPSAFINEIQYIPLDLYSEDFYSNRKKHIDKRLAEIREVWSSDALLFFAMQNWEMNSRKRSLIVSDLVESVDELIEIMSCIGRECLSLLLERLVKDYRQFHSGLPDLFVWDFKKKKCLFVEVKGEKDKLSTKQKLWLNYLRQAKANIEVCHVHTIGSRSTKKIASLRKGPMKTEVL